MILNIILNILFYYKKFRNSPVIITNQFTRLRELTITYFYVIHKYLQNGKYGGVLGYPIQDYQQKITMWKYLMILPV